MARFSLIDQKSDIWLDLYTEGFARFSKQTGQFILVDMPQTLPYENKLSSFVQDKSGDFWMSSNGKGLFRCNPDTKQFGHWTESEGLAFDYCGSALPDRFGNIWVGAYNKVSVLNVTKNRVEGENLYVVNKLQKKAFVETSHKQGLASLQSLYHYLSKRDVDVKETATEFMVIVPLL